MKRILPCLGPIVSGLLLLFLVAAPVRAQVCNTTSLVINSQAQLDTFDCEVFTGSLFIIGADVTDLTPLSGLTSTGAFYLRNSMATSLAGLEDLESAGNVLEFRDNPALTSLTALESLSGEIGNTLAVFNNDALTSLDGLEGLTSVGNFLQVQFNNVLSECSCGLENLISGTPPTFSGVGFNTIIESNGGTCTSPETVLVNPCTPQGPVDLVAVATSNTTVNPGGSISFLYTVTNTTGGAVSGDLFFTARRNGATVAQGVVQSGTLPAGARVGASFTQNVPASAPPGNYSYTLSIGQFPNAAVDSVPFTVTVTGLRERGPEGWTVSEAMPWVDGEQTLQPASSEAVPEAFALEAAYPNPFALSTTVGFALPEAADVRVSVYDVLGREVAVLVDEQLEAGRHSAAFDARGLASGVYLVRMTSDGFVEVQRVTLVR